MLADNREGGVGHKLVATVNASTSTFDDLLRQCWPHQNDCWGCLKEAPCSWCPTSGSCIPNTFQPQIFAPIWDADICPLWSERWELRARSFQCHISTFSVLTFIVAVLGTLVMMGLVALAFNVAKSIEKRWKARTEGWWRFWKHYRRGWWRSWRLELKDITDVDGSESRPLLG